MNLIIGGSGSRKTNVLLNLIKQKDNDDNKRIDKIYLYVKDPNLTKHQYFVRKHENSGFQKFKDSKALFEYSNIMHGVYKKTEEYNTGRKCNMLIAFDGMIADMIINKKLNQTVTEVFIRQRKLNISTVFNVESYYKY